MTKLFKGLIAALLTMALTYAPLASAQSITYSANTLPLSGSCGSVAVNTPCFDVTQTWNAAVNFTGIRENITDTASAAGSLLLDLQVASSSKFSVSKSGQVVAGLGVQVANNGTVGWTDITLARDAANTLALRGGVNAQTFNVYNTYTDASNYEMVSLFFNANNAFLRTTQAGTGTSRALNIGSATGSVVMSNSNLIWNTDNSFDIGASGANRPRNLYIAGQGTFGGTVLGSQLQTSAGLVSGLGAATAGRRGMVTDATVAATGNFGAIVAGGGANTVPVWADGTNWRIG